MGRLMKVLGSRDHIMNLHWVVHYMKDMICQWRVNFLSVWLCFVLYCIVLYLFNPDVIHFS